MSAYIFINNSNGRSNYIIINNANKNKIEAMLNDVQKRAQVRKFSICNIYTMPSKIEHYKDTHNVSWADLEGCIFSFDTYETMPNCYEYKVSYTSVQVIIEKGKCRIASIARNTDFNKRTNAHRNHAALLTDRARQAILENAIYM